MAELSANGLRLHTQRIGETGPAVVFVHGILIDNLASLYFTLANPVAKMARSVLYDLRGHGKSERPASGYFLDDMLDDLAGVLDGYQLAEPVYLVGHSYGGLLSIAFAARHPERVAGLVLLDPPLPLGAWGDGIASLFTFEGPEKDRLFEDAWGSMHGGAMTRKLRRIQQVATALVEETSLMDDMRASRALREDEIAALRCPILALYGESSEIRDHGTRLAALVPHADVRMLEGCSHRVLFEASERVKEQVVAWLAAQLAEPGARELG